MCQGTSTALLVEDGSLETVSVAATRETTDAFPKILQRKHLGTEDRNAQNPLKGYDSMAMSAVCQAGMMFFVHVAESVFGLPSTSALIVRAVVSSLIALIYLYVNNLFHIFKLPASHLFSLGIVGFLSSVSIYCTLIALERLPVGTVVTVVYSSPAITSVLAAVFLHDAFTFSHVLILATNFIGIALVSQPSTVNSSSPESFLIGIAYALAGALSVSVVYVVLRALGHSTHFVLGSVALSVGLVVFSLIFGTVDSVKAIRTNVPGTLFSTISSTCGFGSQVLLNRGLQDAPAGPGVVVRSLNVPISFLLGLIFLHESPNFTGLLGISLVLCSIGAIGWRQWHDDNCRRNYIPISAQREIDT